MALEKTKKELYSKDSHVEEDRKRFSHYDVLREKSQGEIPPSLEDELVNEEEVQTKARSRRLSELWHTRRSVFIGAVIVTMIGFISMVAVIIGIARDLSFDEDRVMLDVEGLGAVESGRQMEYRIHVENDNWSTLRDVSVVVQYPAGFRPDEGVFDVQEGSQKARIDLGTLNSKTSVEHVISGKFFGSKDEIFYMDYFVVYSTQVGGGRFENRLQMPITLTNSSVTLDVIGTSEVTSGEQVEYIVMYKNDTTTPIYNARLVANVSDSFSPTSFDPAYSQKEIQQLIWFLGTIDPGESGEVRVRGGYYQVAPSVGKLFVELGYVQGDSTFHPFVSQEVVTSIVPSLLTSRVRVLDQGEEQSSVMVGQVFDVVIDYANEGDTGLPSGIVQLAVDGDIWEYGGIEIDSGNWNPDTKTITWRASDIPALSDLAPGEKGEIRLKIPVAERLDVSGKNDTNFTSSLRAVIDSPDALSRLGLKHVSGRSEKEVKLQTFIDVSIDVIEVETGKPIQDISFEAGKKVNLEARVRLENPYNDVTNASLEFNLPSEVEFSGMLDGSEDENVEYDERRRKMIWTLGKIDAGTGVYLDSRDIAFNLTFTPQEYQDNLKVKLLDAIRFSGKDVFVDLNLDFLLPPVETGRIRF